MTDARAPAASEPLSAARLLAHYPCLAGIGTTDLAALLQPQAMLHLPAGTVLFTERQPCAGFPLLLAGRIKVVKSAGNGREMLLYRVEAGGSCIITSSCLLGHADYTARGSAETGLILVVLPAAIFVRLLAEHPPFREFVFHLFAERIATLMLRVEEVAFQRLDQRLARLLLGRGDDLQVTHQALADELGSVREIVSRLLKSFAADGLVTLGREHIVVRDRDGLRRLADAGAN